MKKIFTIIAAAALFTATATAQVSEEGLNCEESRNCQENGDRILLAVSFGTSFEDYMASEVLPYAPETWIDESVRDKGPLQDGQVGIVGTNISFNKFFYHYEEPRRPEEIAAEIMELESGLEGFMKEFL